MIENNNVFNTYCDSYQLFSMKNITKKEFIQLLNDLSIEFNNYYNTNNYSFSPETLLNGGIIFNNYKQYKLMQMYFINGCNNTSPLYGWMDDNIKNKWITSDEILIKKDKHIYTNLISFCNTPKWTNQELQIFIKCFEHIGLIICYTPSIALLENMNNSTYYLELFYPK